MSNQDGSDGVIRSVSTEGELEHDLARAISDYLAVSRGAQLYASGDDHVLAEERAWARMERARARLDAHRRGETLTDDDDLEDAGRVWSVATTNERG
jgi:hypothetical protein